MNLGHGVPRISGKALNVLAGYANSTELLQHVFEARTTVGFVVSGAVIQLYIELFQLSLRQIHFSGADYRFAFV
jgi:hypothetical protein